MNKPEANISLEDIENDINNINSELLSLDGPAFPVKIFPHKIQEIIISTNECLDFPIDFIGASILFAASIGMGATYKVQVKNGWLESATIYVAIVGRAGTNKSHPLTWALNPIQKKDRQSFRLYESQMNYYQEALTLTKGEREDQGITEPQKPYWIKSLLTDFTPEALIEVHKHNQRGVGIYVDELASWFKSFSRYSKGAETEFWLSSWSNKAITVDRKGSEPTYIASPFIPVIGTMQPSVLNELSGDNRASNGFLDRILFTCNKNLKSPYWSDKELPKEISMTWDSIVDNLYDMKMITDEEGNLKSNILYFDPHSKNLLYKWQKKIADESNNLENDSLAGMYSKIQSYCIRFSLILEILKCATTGNQPTSVSVESVKGAIELAEYFKATGLIIHSLINKSINPIDKLPLNKKRFVMSLPDEFKTSEAIQIAIQSEVPERTAKRLLNDNTLFQRIRTGGYKKKK
jgi:hypothetical protein